MIRSILLQTSICCVLLLAGCSASGDPPKDTLPQTNRPPDPAPGTAAAPANRMRKARPIEAPAGTPEATTPIPGPENSQLSTRMNEDGSISEIRTFASHPELVRAELIWTEPANKVLKLEFRNRAASTARVSESLDLRKATIQELIAAGTSSASGPAADQPRAANVK